MSPKRAIKIVLFLIYLAQAATQGINIAGYLTVTDVSQHSFIDLDIRDVEDKLVQNLFTEASVPYIFGGNSLLPNRLFRTLQDLGLDMESRAKRIRNTGDRLITEFQLFADYFDGNPSYANAFILDKMSSSAEGMDKEARKVLILRGIQLQVAWMNAWFEFNNALEGCLSGDVRAVAWDEGVAFYTGSIVQSAANALEGKLQCTVAQQYNDRFPDALNANDLAFVAFENGRAFVQEKDCNGLERALGVVRRQMLIPLFQGLIYHTKRADSSLVASPSEADKAEAWSFALALLPFVNASDVAKAAELHADLKYGSPLATYNSSLVESAVLATLESTCLACADIGINAPGCEGINVSSSCPEPFESAPGSIGLASSQGLFSIPAFFIVFREALEASIVCAVLYGIIKKTNRPELKKFVWYGIVLGLVMTLAALVVLLVVVSTLAEGAGVEQRRILQGSLSICAAVLVAYLALTIGKLLNIQKKIESRVQTEVETKDGGISWKTVFFLSFTAIAREGIETVVFLGVGSNFEAISLPIPILTGAALGITIGFLLYYAGSKVALKVFFRVTVVFLVFIGAGIFAHGIEEFQTVFDYGEYWEYVVWNLSKYTSLRFEFWGLMRALFGWTPYPSRLELVSYICYHIAVWGALLVKYIIHRVDTHAHRVAEEQQVEETETETEISKLTEKPSAAVEVA